MTEETDYNDTRWKRFRIFLSNLIQHLPLSRKIRTHLVGHLLPRKISQDIDALKEDIDITRAWYDKIVSDLVHIDPSLETLFSQASATGVSGGWLMVSVALEEALRFFPEPIKLARVLQEYAMEQDLFIRTMQFFAEFHFMLNKQGYLNEDKNGVFVSDYDATFVQDALIHHWAEALEEIRPGRYDTFKTRMLSLFDTKDSPS